MKINIAWLVAASVCFLSIGILFQNCSSGFTALSDSGSLGSGATLSFSTVKDEQLEQLQYKCTDPGYTNFNCVKKEFTTKEGLAYSVILRWNRVNSEDSVGTVVWVLGGQGSGKWRSYPGAVEIEDSFDRSQKIRSVEVDFVDEAVAEGASGGYWVHGGGYYSAALAYMEVIAYISANLKVGSFLNHVGGSNGTMVAAYALSHFDAGSFVDRFILHAGPFLPNFSEACDPNHFASFHRSPAMLGVITGFVGSWAYKDPKKNPCTLGDMNARMSVLAGAKNTYPNNGIHVVMGEKEKVDGFGPWIIESNYHWYSQVEAAEKTYQILGSIGHEMEWSSVRTYAAMGKPQPMGPAPTLTFSLAQDGPAVTHIPANARVYGVIRNIDANSAMGCMQESGGAANCENPRKWTKLPNGDWTFSDGVWRTSFVPAEKGFMTGKSFQGFNVNLKTGQRTPVVNLVITAEARRSIETPSSGGTPTMAFSKAANGEASVVFGLNEVVYGVSKNLPQNGTKACMQEASQFHLCSDPNNWTSLPNQQWQYVGGEWRAQFVPGNIGAQKGKSYIAFQVNTVTGQRTPNVMISVQDTAAPAPSSGGTAISEGLFVVGVNIYYSNGSAYCYFPNMDFFTQRTGRTNVSGIRVYSSLPQIMRNDGVCQ